jgi:hypothetical protein
MSEKACIFSEKSAMAELKTKKNPASIEEFLSAVEDDKKREDSFKVHKLMQEVTGDEGSMWGPSIVGYGSYHYKYASGQEGDWMATGFSPRKNAITLYIMSGFDNYDHLLEKLGKFKTGKACLYVKKLEDIDREVLKELVKESVKFIQEKYPPQ